MSTTPAVAAVDGDWAAAWRRSTVPWWVPRIVLVVAWALALVASVWADWSTQCTAADPSVCGPDVGFAWASIALLAVPLLAWALPVMACVVGLVWVALDLRFDDVPGARLAWAVFGVVTALVLTWLLVARSRQRRLVREHAVASSATLPFGSLSAVSRVRPLPWALAFLFAVLGAATVGWYLHVTDIDRAHVAASELTEAVVTDVDSTDVFIVVTLPVTTSGLDAPVERRIGVWDVAPYDEGDVVPMRVHVVDGEVAWARPVAEPDDRTPWLTLGLGLIAAAAVIATRELVRRRALRRLATVPSPALAVVIGPDAEGYAVLYAATDVRRTFPLARLPVVNRVDTPGLLDRSLLRLGEDEPPVTEIDGPEDWEVWDREEIDAFGRAWRGEPEPERTTDAEVGDPFGPFPLWARPDGSPVQVVGDLVDGGWAAVVHEGSVLVPSGPLRAWRRTYDKHLDIVDPRAESGYRDEFEEGPPEMVAGSSDVDLLPGRPLDLSATAVVPSLPVVLRRTMRDRALGLMAVGLAVVAPAVVFVTDAFGGWEYGTAMTLFAAAEASWWGLNRWTTRVVLDHSGVTVVERTLVHRIPWGRMHGARTVPAPEALVYTANAPRSRLLLAWEPDVVVSVAGLDTSPPDVFAPPGTQPSAEAIGVSIERLRERGLAAGDPGGEVRVRVRPAVALPAVYAVAAVGSVVLALT